MYIETTKTEKHNTLRGKEKECVSAPHAHFVLRKLIILYFGHFYKRSVTLVV